MKQVIALLLAISFVLSACTSVTPTAVVVVVTATEQKAAAGLKLADTATLPPPPTDTQVPPSETPVPPTDTPLPPTDTPTPAPTDTPEATATPKRISVKEFEAMLQTAGYKREPFTGIGTYTDLRPGKEGYIYIKDNVYEPIKVYKDGYVRMEVLNDLSNRASHMENKFKTLDGLFPPEFMAELRKANDAYLETAGRSVSGDAAQSWPPAKQDRWKSFEGQYNVTNTTIGSTPVAFSLWFWQVACPAGYICWFSSFPGVAFTGQTSFVFYNVELNLAP